MFLVKIDTILSSLFCLYFSKNLFVFIGVIWERAKSGPPKENIQKPVWDIYKWIQNFIISFAQVAYFICVCVFSPWLDIVMAAENPSNVKKGSLCPFFDYLTPWFSPRNDSRMLKFPVTGPHNSGMYLPGMEVLH